MTQTFVPLLDILPAEQRALWPQLGTIPRDFTLYGGTAIALQLGHRMSVDFDFFGSASFDPDRLRNTTPLLREAMPVQMEASTLTCLLGDPATPVRVSFFGLPRLGRIAAPLLASDTGLPVASLLDLAATKMAVVQKRAEAKDYIDIDALIGAGIGLSEALVAGRQVHGDAFNPQITLKALAYFGDPELAALPAPLKRRLRRAVAAVDAATLP